MQVAELLVGAPAPVLYWEQGHEWLFGDPVRFQVCPPPHVLPLSSMFTGSRDMSGCMEALCLCGDIAQGQLCQPAFRIAAMHECGGSLITIAQAQHISPGPVNAGLECLQQVVLW